MALENKPVILLFGPTAVGKTNLLKQLNDSRFEIINADSAQVYRQMNIGTAKPDLLERQALPHHLLDIKDPDQTFNVGEFIKRADQAVLDITGRNKIPIISGGTAFYFKHFIFGLPDTPKSDPVIRQQLIREKTDRGLAALYRELKQIDPGYAVKISAHDPARILRALEIYRKAGRPLSSYKPASKARKAYDFLYLGIRRPRQELWSRIDRRVDRMFEEGLLAEVKALYQSGCRESSPGLRAIGYREFGLMRSGCVTLADIKQRIKAASRAYAKRQMTFFKSLPQVQWFAPEDLDSIKIKIEEFIDHLSSNG